MRRVRIRTRSGDVRDAEWTDDGAVVVEGERRALEDVDLLPPIDPGKLVCAASNYQADVEDGDIPEEPVLFLKTPNTVTGPGTRVRLPDSDRVLFEGELAVVIGERCRNVAAENAVDYVAGFTCANDITNRAQDNVVRRKSFDGAAPLGPVVAPPERVDADAAIEVRINGEVRQQSTLSRLVFTVSELVASISADITLELGDVVLTGSPPGMAPLRDGDRVEVEIDGIGCLEHTVAFP